MWLSGLLLKSSLIWLFIFSASWLGKQWEHVIPPDFPLFLLREILEKPSWHPHGLDCTIHSPPRPRNSFNNSSPSFSCKSPKKYFFPKFHHSHTRIIYWTIHIFYTNTSLTNTKILPHSLTDIACGVMEWKKESANFQPLRWLSSSLSHLTLESGRGKSRNMEKKSFSSPCRRGQNMNFCWGRLLKKVMLGPFLGKSSGKEARLLGIRTTR